MARPTYVAAGSHPVPTTSVRGADNRRQAVPSHVEGSDDKVSGPVTDPVTRRVQVRNKAGLHARPAMMLSMEAKEFESEIELVLSEVPDDHHLEPGTRADAKNSIELISLGAPLGTTLDIEATGPDADAAVGALAHLFDTAFGLEDE